jgi:hypothetical protein
VLDVPVAGVWKSNHQRGASDIRAALTGGSMSRSPSIVYRLTTNTSSTKVYRKYQGLIYQAPILKHVVTYPYSRSFRVSLVDHVHTTH